MEGVTDDKLLRSRDCNFLGTTITSQVSRRNDYIILSYYDSYDDPKNRYIYTCAVSSKKNFKPESLLPKNFKPKVIELVNYPLLNPCGHNTTTKKRKLNSRPNEEYEVPNEE